MVFKIAINIFWQIKNKKYHFGKGVTKCISTAFKYVNRTIITTRYDFIYNGVFAIC